MWTQKREAVKKFALSVASALLTVVALGGLVAADEAAAGAEEGAVVASPYARPLTLGWD